MGQLTALKINNLKEPGRYSDGDGLVLIISARGTASWVQRATIAGRRREIGLGSLKLFGLADARAKSLELRRQIANGVDPIVERRKIEDPVPSFAEAAARVHQEHKAGWKDGKHHDQWINTLAAYAFPKFGKLLVNDIEGPIIRDVLAPIRLSKPETARRVRQRIAAILDWSYAKGYRPTEAPMRSLARELPRQPRKDGHFAAMPFNEVPDLIARLREQVTVARLTLEVLILTGARYGEIRGMTWDEVDFEAGLWSVPAERMKMGRTHHVPLAAETLKVLKRADALYRVPCSKLIFPGQKLKTPMSDMTLKIMRDMETGVTVHGFRSAFRDWVAEEINHPGEIAEATLAHDVSNKVEAAYRRTDYLEKRRALMREWAAFCISKVRAAEGHAFASTGTAQGS